MGQINLALFATLDLVGQAPGGPGEDPDGDFPFEGWQAPLVDDVAGEQIGAAYEGTDALLLGRRTYDIFAGYWPHQDDEIGRLFRGEAPQTLRSGAGGPPPSAPATTERKPAPKPASDGKLGDLPGATGLSPA